jgi:nitroimidazol reductase NimA-like FMN-containing flavoprotein (pyridoxamine 5'-phosphate oxidase superfamily)
VHETAVDLERLQAILDQSYGAAGRHLRDVITPERRLTAAELAAHLSGMCLLVLATRTRDGRPTAAPVDGIFYRGAWHFGSAPDSRRFAHIRRDPRVSAVHLPSEELSVTVHGRAAILDLASAEHEGFRRALLDIYVPRYGPDWEAILASALYARIEADRMFTFWMPETEAASPA